MEAVHQFEGTVNQVMGDGIMALFGAPLAREDHAVRACYAALRMHAEVGRYAEDLRCRQGLDVQIRVGLNSSEVVVRSISNDLHMDYSAVGETTHLAARMEQLARPGTTFLTKETMQLTEGFIEFKALGAVSLRGLTEPIQVYELLRASSVRSRLQAGMSRGLSRFVGRQAELAHLEKAMEQVREGHGQVVAVLGEPGVGKSRLLCTRPSTRLARMDGSCLRQVRSGAGKKGNPVPNRDRSCQELLQDRQSRRPPCDPG